MSVGQAQLFDHPDYKALIEGLDIPLLEQTVPHAREAYRRQLDGFIQVLEDEYDLENPVMSPFTLGNWLVQFLYEQDKLPELLAKHERVPIEALRDGLPELLRMLDDIDDDAIRQEWQRAMCILSLPLIAE